MTKLVICACSTHQRVSYAKIRTLVEMLPNKVDFSYISDLCGVAVCQPEQLYELESADFIVACFPRAVKSQLQFAGLQIDQQKIVNLRELSPRQALEQMNLAVDEPANQTCTLPKWDQSWTPWNPVIDYDLCINCGKCADFCLFGVYEFSDQKIRVKNPEQCKTNCPACARVCPKSAIIFPKYEKSPINGGVEVEETLPVDPALARSGNVYEKLASRRRSKRKLLKDEN